jgi:phosphatidate cytidylyltransferase
MASELAKRVMVAAVGIPAAAIIIYLGGWYLAGLLAIIAALGTQEFYRLARAKGIEPFDTAGGAAAVLLIVSAAASPPIEAAVHLWNATVALALFTGALAIWKRWPEGKPLTAWVTTVAGAVFVGGTLSYAMWLRQFPVHSTHAVLPPPDLSIAWRGTALIAFPLLITWINDSLAYFVGRAIGRHKLIPRVSPGKTIEGALAGLVGGVIVAVLLGRSLLGPQVGIAASAIEWALGGALVAAVAQIGDLAESLLKREAGVKDSGTLLPGHGGVLDRFDALFFAVPVSFWFLRWLGLQ